MLSALTLMCALALLVAGCGGGDLTSALGMWAWKGGSNSVNANGSYGTLGSFAPGNIPGARSAAASWRDGSGNLWLFGGFGYDGLSASQNLLNDLWQFNGIYWAWMGGSSSGGAAGAYGTPGLPNAANMPGARQHALSWVDGFGNRWLFGGFGIDSKSAQGFLNDLWKYDGANWTWAGGSNVVNVKGVYGTLGAPATANIPGSRQGAAGWVDAAGNRWLFGGYGYDAAGTLGFLNDLWKFDGTNWSWMGGSSVANAKGSYGTMNVAAPANTPGARQLVAYWRDSAGNFILFGGYGSDSAGTGVTGTPGAGGALNDLWKYDTVSRLWTWIGGSSLANSNGVYGKLNLAAPGNIPGARSDAAFCLDSMGNLWLFGGSGYDALSASGYLNDLWRYDGINWTWSSGSSVVNSAGNYGTLGNAAASNVPGARAASTGWCNGKYPWLFGGNGLDGTASRGALNDLWRFQP